MVRFRIKDPHRPKRYNTSFLIFYQAILPAMKHEDSEVGLGEWAKRAGKLWNRLPKWQKKVFQRRAAHGKRQYLQRLKKYKPPSQRTLLSKYGKVPKHFVPSYAYFVKEQFDRYLRRHPRCTFVQVSRVLAKRWNDMSDRQKKPYTDQHIRDWRRYLDEMGKYRQGEYCHCCTRNKGMRRLTPTTPGGVKCRY